MDTDPRTIALVLARGRVVFGLLSLVVPGLVAKLVLGANSPHSRALLRMVGIRDVALGVGAITSLKEETQDAEWVAMGALADAGDSLAMWLAPIGWRRFANALFAKSMAIVGLLCARQLADQRTTSAEAGAPALRIGRPRAQKSMPESAGIHLPARVTASRHRARSSVPFGSTRAAVTMFSRGRRPIRDDLRRGRP